MPTKLQLLSELAENTAKGLTSSFEDWTGFLIIAVLIRKSGKPVTRKENPSKSCQLRMQSSTQSWSALWTTHLSSTWPIW